MSKNIVLGNKPTVHTKVLELVQTLEENNISLDKIAYMVDVTEAAILADEIIPSLDELQRHSLKQAVDHGYDHMYLNNSVFYGLIFIAKG